MKNKHVPYLRVWWARVVKTWDQELGGFESLCNVSVPNPLQMGLQYPQTLRVFLNFFYCACKKKKKERKTEKKRQQQKKQLLLSR